MLGKMRPSNSVDPIRLRRRFATSAGRLTIVVLAATVIGVTVGAADQATPPRRPDAPQLVIVNLDPLHMQHGHVEVPLDRVGAAASDASYTVRDVIDEVNYEWRGAWNYVRFDPEIRQGHILWLPKPRV